LFDATESSSWLAAIDFTAVFMTEFNDDIVTPRRKLAVK